MASRSTQIVELKDEKQVFSVGRDEKAALIVLLGDKNNSEQNIEVELVGEGAEGKILGIIVGRNSASFTLNTVQRHVAPNTTSDLLVKGVFYDKSKLRYRGLIEIAQGAQNSNAFQQENNLVLSNDVDIDTRPELEIEANEVRCTHAATVGKIDPEELYYIRTRGVDKRRAEKMIIEGFLAEVMERIRDRDVKRKIEKKIKRLLD